MSVLQCVALCTCAKFPFRRTCFWYSLVGEIFVGVLDGDLICILVAWAGLSLPFRWVNKGYTVCILFDIYQLKSKIPVKNMSLSICFSPRHRHQHSKEKLAFATVTCNPFLLLPFYSQLSDKEPGLTDRKSIAIKKT